MPRRSTLSAVERSRLLALPNEPDDLIRYYTLNELDRALIRQRRGDANRLGFAIQLCLLRYPGNGWSIDALLPQTFLQWVSGQLHIDFACWSQYAERDETRREHLLELRSYLGLASFGLTHFRQTVHALTELALQTDKSIVLATQSLNTLRDQRIIIPAVDVIERICAKAITLANRHIHAALTDALSIDHRQRLDELLKRKEDSKTTWLAWLRQSPVKRLIA
jgi:TnpA family transposase